MNLRHRLVVFFVLVFLAVIGLWRLSPSYQLPVWHGCRYPVGISRSDQRITIICLPNSRISLATLLPQVSDTSHKWQQKSWVQAGELVRITPKGQIMVQLLPGSLRMTLGLPIDINQATEADLLALPHIGPGLAQRILVDRKQRGPFTSLTDLQRVPGIGPLTVKRLQTLIGFGVSVQGHKGSSTQPR